MTTLIINGFDNNFKLPHISKIKTGADAECNDIVTFELAKMKINGCAGCETCMFKTPGYCIFKDDTEIILKHWLRADLILFFFPVKQGFMNYLTKKIIDRLFRLELPYIEFEKGRFTHPLRYKKRVDIGFVIDIPDMKYWSLNLANNRHIGDYYGKFLFQKSLAEYHNGVHNETLHI